MIESSFTFQSPRQSSRDHAAKEMHKAKVEISPESNKFVKEYAQDKGCTVDEAVDSLIATAAGRLAATRKYAATQAGKKPIKAPKAAKAKKTAKAKGPIARKAKGAKKAPKAAAEAPAAEAQA